MPPKKDKKVTRNIPAMNGGLLGENDDEKLTNGDLRPTNVSSNDVRKSLKRALIAGPSEDDGNDFDDMPLDPKRNREGEETTGSQSVKFEKMEVDFSALYDDKETPVINLTNGSSEKQQMGKEVVDVQKKLKRPESTAVKIKRTRRNLSPVPVGENRSTISKSKLAGSSSPSHKRKRTSLTILAVPKAPAGSMIFATGDNEVGQLGMERDDANRFVEIPSIPEKIVACAAGGMHSLVLSEKGNVFSFGCNDDGSLGRLTVEEEDCIMPDRVVLDGAKIAKIAAGNIHSMALSTDCHVFIWGSYRDNQGPFGISPENPGFITKPLKLSMPEQIVDIACGADHTLMLSVEGNVYTMGCADHGRLGRVRRSHCGRENRRARQVMLTPSAMVVVRKRTRLRFDRIWAARYCSFARRSTDGTIWGCGLNNFHQLGKIDDGDHVDNFVYHPVMLQAFDPSKIWVDISGGEQHTLALDNEGTVYSMGRVLYGRLGLGKGRDDDPDVVELTPIPSLEKRIVAIAAGDHTSFALDRDGQVWCWGQGANILGQGDRDTAPETDIFVPTLCTSKRLKDKKVTQIKAGSNHALCIARD